MVGFGFYGSIKMNNVRKVETASFRCRYCKQSTVKVLFKKGTQPYKYIKDS